MFHRGVLATLLLSSAIGLAQEPNAVAVAPHSLPVSTTLPIVFTRTINAGDPHSGQAILAKTAQAALLPNGTTIPSGAKITGHVIAVERFVYDKTPYAQQKPATLSVKFDSIEVAGIAVPLNVTVRAMADPLTSWGARQPDGADMDSSFVSFTQVGGDTLRPSEHEVRNLDGDVVAYNKHGGVYAHLVRNGRCDGGDVEVSLGIYSASACGLYGFTDVIATQFGSAKEPSTLTLASSRVSPKIWKYSTALLEVMPVTQTMASR